MPLRSWRSSSAKQPPKDREPQKPAKKNLEDACIELRKTALQERIEKLEAQKREQDRAQEEEMMAMTYGPNWRIKMPAWATEAAPSPVESVEAAPVEDDEEDEDVIIPLPRRSEIRLKRKAS